MHTEHIIPGGPNKGTALPSADDKTIKYWLDRKQNELAENPNGRFATASKGWVDAARAELERRKARGQQQAAPTTTALQKAPATPVAVVLGSAMNDAAAVTAKLVELAASHHLVSPASHVDGMPSGCGIALSYVTVNPDEKAGEVYAVGGGKVGLSAVTLSKIGAAAGVSWDPEKSGLGSLAPLDQAIPELADVREPVISTEAAPADSP